MREILFRGKRIDNGEWVEGDLVGGNMICPTLEDVEDAMGTYYGQIPYVGFIEIIPETVGQFTGLKDKNGVRIFEGDIVHCVARLDEANCVVIYEEGEFRLISERNYKTYTTGMGYHAIRCFEKEVIGNIHDNPKLLRK